MKTVFGRIYRIGDSRFSFFIFFYQGAVYDDGIETYADIIACFVCTDGRDGAVLLLAAFLLHCGEMAPTFAPARGDS